MDYPKSEWSEEDATANCLASAEMGGGEITEVTGESNCAVDQFDTTWRCDATDEATSKPYYAYAESLPKGICDGPLMGTVVYRPESCCWEDY